MNDKTEVRAYGGRGRLPEKVQIGPLACRELRDPVRYLGVFLNNRLSNTTHAEKRGHKGLQAVGRLNAVWASHPGIS